MVASCQIPGSRVVSVSPAHGFTCGHLQSRNFRTGSRDNSRSPETAGTSHNLSGIGKEYGLGSTLNRMQPIPIRRQESSGFSFRCSASDETELVDEKGVQKSMELPLFPLPLVLFPGAILPLQIFEFRYRIMMHTLLQTDLRLGIIYTDKSSGLVTVGCVGEVVKHERLVDDRFFIILKGQERFRVLDVVRTKPYLVAKVVTMEDPPAGEQEEEVEALAKEVEGYMKDVIRLSHRVNGKPEKDPPDDLRKDLLPSPFSFWVGSTFEGAPVEQQALLELEDTAQRLNREKATLEHTLNYLRAAAAVKDAFPSTPSAE